MTRKSLPEPAKDVVAAALVAGESLLMPQFQPGLVCTGVQLVSDMTGHLWIVDPQRGTIRRPRVLPAQSDRDDHQ